MKKLIAFASAAALGLGLAACGGAEEEPVVDDTMTTTDPMMEDPATTGMGMEAEADSMAAESDMATDPAMTTEEDGAMTDEAM